jgi:hypothetical protein
MNDLNKKGLNYQAIIAYTVILLVTVWIWASIFGLI